jgi:hypothetical protein
MGHADNTMLRQIYDQTDEAGNVRAARERYARDHTAPAPAKPKGTGVARELLRDGEANPLVCAGPGQAELPPEDRRGALRAAPGRAVAPRSPRSSTDATGCHLTEQA